MMCGHMVISVPEELRIHISAFGIPSQPKQQALFRAQYSGDMNSKIQTGLHSRKVFAACWELRLYKFILFLQFHFLTGKVTDILLLPVSEISVFHITQITASPKETMKMWGCDSSLTLTQSRWVAESFCHICDYCHVEATHCPSVQTV